MRNIENLDNMLGTSKSKLIEPHTTPSHPKEEKTNCPSWVGWIHVQLSHWLQEYSIPLVPSSLTKEVLNKGNVLKIRVLRVPGLVPKSVLSLSLSLSPPVCVLAVLLLFLPPIFFVSLCANCPKPALSLQTLRLTAGLPASGSSVAYFYKLRLFAVLLAA